MRILLLINGEAMPLPDRPAPPDPDRPMLDYHALACGLRQGLGAELDLLDARTAQRSADPRVRLACAAGGPEVGAATLAFLDRDRYDAVFTVGEVVGIPLALLFKGVRNRPRHVTLGHRMTAPKKDVFYRLLRVQREMDRVFVYSEYQREFARRVWGADADKVRVVPYCVDADFFRPAGPKAVRPGHICSIGSEWRDQETLIRAMRTLPDLTLHLTAFSPWTKDARGVEQESLPPNVEARRYSYRELRALYDSCMFSVVPVRDADFAAGITAIIEAMAMGKPVVTTATRGCNADIVRDGETGLLVPLHDADAMAHAIRRLSGDPDLCARMGANARRWVEENATLGHWVGRIADAMQEALRQPEEPVGYRRAPRSAGREQGSL